VGAISPGGEKIIYDIWVKPKKGDDVLRWAWVRKILKQEKNTKNLENVHLAEMAG